MEDHLIRSALHEKKTTQSALSKKPNWIKWLIYMIIAGLVLLFGYLLIYDNTKYYVNKNSQKNGDHEVHQSACRYLPKSQNRIYLGAFGNCEEAIEDAKSKYSKSNGCYYCSNSCHTN